MFVILMANLQVNQHALISAVAVLKVVAVAFASIQKRPMKDLPIVFASSVEERLISTSPHSRLQPTYRSLPTYQHY